MDILYVIIYNHNLLDGQSIYLVSVPLPVALSLQFVQDVTTLFVEAGMFFFSPLQALDKLDLEVLDIWIFQNWLFWTVIRLGKDE